MDNSNLAFVSAIAALISAITALVTVFWNVHKAKSDRKIEYAKGMLKNVYSPLFAYFAKQEAFRHLCNNPESLSPAEVPIFSVKKKHEEFTAKDGKISSSATESPVCGLVPDNILDVCKNPEFGIAPASLIVLMNAYKLALDLAGEIKSHDEIKANLFKVNIEKEIRDNVFCGFNYYQEQLSHPKAFNFFHHNKSDNGMGINSFAKIDSNEILFFSEEPESEIKKIQEDKENHPEKYK